MVFLSFTLSGGPKLSEMNLTSLPPLSSDHKRPRSWLLPTPELSVFLTLQSSGKNILSHVLTSVHFLLGWSLAAWTPLPSLLPEGALRIAASPGPVLPAVFWRFRRPSELLHPEPLLRRPGLCSPSFPSFSCLLVSPPFGQSSCWAASPSCHWPSLCKSESPALTSCQLRVPRVLSSCAVPLYPGISRPLDSLVSYTGFPEDAFVLLSGWPCSVFTIGSIPIGLRWPSVHGDRTGSLTVLCRGARFTCHELEEGTRGILGAWIAADVAWHWNLWKSLPWDQGQRVCFQNSPCFSEMSLSLLLFIHPWLFLPFSSCHGLLSGLSPSLWTPSTTSPSVVPHMRGVCGSDGSLPQRWSLEASVCWHSRREGSLLRETAPAVLRSVATSRTWGVRWCAVHLQLFHLPAPWFVKAGPSRGPPSTHCQGEASYSVLGPCNRCLRHGVAPCSAVAVLVATSLPSGLLSDGTAPGPLTASSVCSHTLAPVRLLPPWLWPHCSAAFPSRCVSALSVLSPTPSWELGRPHVWCGWLCTSPSFFPGVSGRGGAGLAPRRPRAAWALPAAQRLVCSGGFYWLNWNFFNFWDLCELFWGCSFPSLPGADSHCEAAVLAGNSSAAYWSRCVRAGCRCARTSQPPLFLLSRCKSVRP